MSHDLQIDIAETFQKKMIANNAKYPVEKAKGRSDKYDRLYRDTTKSKIVKLCKIRNNTKIISVINKLMKILTFYIQIKPKDKINFKVSNTYPVQ